MFDVGIARYDAMVPTMIVAIRFYVNFFTNHWLPDVRWVLLVLVQETGWTLVHASKIGSWTVLVIFSFMLVLWFKQKKRTVTES